MSSAASTPGITERQKFMKGPGFVLYNDIAEQLFERLVDQPLPSLEAFQDSKNELIAIGLAPMPSSSVNLYTAARLFREQVPYREITTSEERTAIFGLTDEEQAEAKPHTYDLGIDDLDFAWHFAPAIASAVVHTFAEDKLLPKETADNLKLSEWADIIESGWFGELIKDLALTGFGVYASHGVYSPDYAPQSLRQIVTRNFHQPAIITSVNPHIPGLKGLSATLSNDLKQRLRKLRQAHSHYRAGPGSIGCPVARDAAMLPENYAETMPRALRLQALGRLTISDKPNSQGMLLAQQEESAIDRNLQLIADQLRALEWYHGEIVNSPLKQ